LESKVGHILLTIKLTCNDCKLRGWLEVEGKFNKLNNYVLHTECKLRCKVQKNNHSEAVTGDIPYHMDPTGLIILLYLSWPTAVTTEDF